MLPEYELEKSFRLLTAMLSIAYNRRFKLEKNNPSKWWYWDLSDLENEKKIIILRNIAEKFRQQRLAQGAVHIDLPDINLVIDNDGKIIFNRINRESPGRMLVTEIMILANWLMATFLAQHKIPAIYRSQPEPRERLYKGNNGTVFQNCIQRRHLSRFVLNNKPEYHSGLGLNAYITATSPIRKYFDLVNQRQIRSILGLEAPYTHKEIDKLIQILELPMSNVSRLQYRRKRYWLLKYLEEKIGQKQEAVVLYKLRNNYRVLLTEYMLECDLPLLNGVNIKPEDLIQVTIQHVNARKDIFSVFFS